MAFPEKMAQHLTYSFIGECLPQKSQKDLERIEYGLAIFFIALPKFVALLSAAIFFHFRIDKFLVYFAVALLSYGLVRAYAWGIHLKDDFSCFIGSFILLFGITFMSIFYVFPWYLILVLWGVSCGLLYCFAPAATAARPLRSAVLRKKLRKKLLAVILLLFIMALMNMGNPYGKLITLGVFWESIFTTPWMYKLFKLKGGETNEKEQVVCYTSHHVK
ncbi:accessory gene regulator B family protein [Natronincola ferrireducens]|uniref:Accessory gene regulator B n=1 Tax=Natronincola ferrireducens TaxID=393762 RepID=A0A1G9F3V1_9FIRM|nr:accessory gene regulator B family protein [Natronincola ferrireducens]SDK83041.1 accessory gene regulator B [Natronincola ferrireducens]